MYRGSGVIDAVTDVFIVEWNDRFSPHNIRRNKELCQGQKFSIASRTVSGGQSHPGSEKKLCRKLMFIIIRTF